MFSEYRKVKQMVHGEKCPICKSQNTGDGEMHYTHEPTSRISASWDCDDCGCSYEVLYKAQEITVVPYEVTDNWEDLNYDKEYTIKL